MIPKGSGSENNSFLKMAMPAEGIDAIKTFVVDCVIAAGGKTCPPTIVGVGVGGTSDLCVALAKRAATRPLGSRCDDADGATLEAELDDRGQPARRRPAGPRRRLDGVRRARRARGDAHHDESGRREHAMPFGAARARDVHAGRRRRTDSEPWRITSFAMPVTEAQVRALRVNDTVTLQSTLFGIRDATQIAMFDRGPRPRASTCAATR